MIKGEGLKKFVKLLGGLVMSTADFITDNLSTNTSSPRKVTYRTDRASVLARVTSRMRKGDTAVKSANSTYKNVYLTKTRKDIAKAASDAYKEVKVDRRDKS